MDEHDDADCAFCSGREAAHRGEALTANPFIPADSAVGSAEWYDTDFGLWEAGHGLGAHERDAPSEGTAE